jgi:hypothetical protein
MRPIAALFRHNNDGNLAIVVEAEREALRWESGKVSGQCGRRVALDELARNQSPIGLVRLTTVHPRDNPATAVDGERLTDAELALESGAQNE